MTRPDLEAKYEAKRSEAPEEAWGTEGSRRVRLVQNHAIYAGMIQAMDEAVGTVLDALDEADLAERTVVVFMSDNGGLSTSEGHPTSNLPLRAGKGWLYEGGIREPMIIKWPGVTAPGSVSDAPVISTDFYPTMLDMAGLPLMEDQHVDGMSLEPLLRATGSVDRNVLYWHYPHYGNQGGSPGSAVRAGDWKLIQFFDGDRFELYDLANDIGETNDLAGAEPARVEELRAMLRVWHREVGALFPSPNPAGTHH
jgi:arylsulfatase A-like enzyme